MMELLEEQYRIKYGSWLCTQWEGMVFVIPLTTVPTADTWQTLNRDLMTDRAMTHRIPRAASLVNL